MEKLEDSKQNPMLMRCQIRSSNWPSATGKGSVEEETMARDPASSIDVDMNPVYGALVIIIQRRSSNDHGVEDVAWRSSRSFSRFSTSDWPARP